MNCPTEIIKLINKYLDDDISEMEEKMLRQHLHKCANCNQHFLELKKTAALIKSTSSISAPAHFTIDLMNKLPKEKRTVSVKRWFRQHPFIIAASLFLLLMTGSIFSMWNDQNMSVSKQENLIVENNTVIVPMGEVIEGDIIVKNGSIRIEGEVRGDVTVINGEKYLASAGKVTGEIKEVNKLFDWLWYNIKEVGKDVFQLVNENNKK